MVKKLSVYADNPPSLKDPKEVLPVGVFVYVEKYSEAEAINTSIALPELKTKSKNFQGVVKSLGPKVDSNWNINVGDRIFWQGDADFLTPVLSEEKRPTVVIEASHIRCVLLCKPSKAGKLPEPYDVRAVGSALVFEMLTDKDIVSTSLDLPEEHGSVSGGPPQGILYSMGPRVDPSWGFTLNDRVVLSGYGIQLPVLSKDGRQLCVSDVHSIKAILTHG